MKKILALAATAVMFTTSIFAFGLAGVGAKAGVNFGAGTTLEGDIKKAAEVKRLCAENGLVPLGYGSYYNAADGTDGFYAPLDLGLRKMAELQAERKILRHGHVRI